MNIALRKKPPHSTSARRQGGATVIEYALIAALIGIALVVALGTLGDGIGTKFDEVNTVIDTAGD